MPALRQLACLLLGASFSVPQLSFAAGASPPAAAPKVGRPTSTASASEAQARVHYTRGVELYDQRNYAEALLEFERAYALYPTPRLLFTLGQVHYGLEHHAPAFLALRAYLDRVGSEVPPERRSQVERQLEALRPEVGYLNVLVDVAGTQVSIDGEDAGLSPLPRPVIVHVGQRRVSAVHAGYASAHLQVNVVSADLAEASFHLEPLQDRSGARESKVETTWWIVTGSLAALTLASGIVTAVQHHRYEDNRTKPQDGDPATASRELEHQSSLVSKWALATDLFAAATLVSGGVAVYLRLRPKDVTEGAPPSSAALSSAEIMASFQF